jgi:predicted amidohydrolase
VPSGSDYSNAPVQLRVATVCTRSDPDPSVNKKNIIQFIDKIVLEHPDVQLIVFGELSLGYYYRKNSPEKYQYNVSESIPSSFTDTLCTIAAFHHFYLSFGMAEKSGEFLFNSQVLIDTTGSIISVHRKVRMTEYDKLSGFQPGTSATFNQIHGIKTATIICYDGLSARLAKEITDNKTQLVILSLADPRIEYYSYDHRALVYNSWVVAANRVGKEDDEEYDGHYFVSEPSGRYHVMKKNEEGYIFTIVGIKL